MDKQLHIITHEVPYAGNADMFSSVIFKIRALKSNGFRIHLHCFESDKPRRSSLENLCDNVYYYKRRQFIRGMETLLPYTLSTRSNPELIERLMQDDHPILFEGLQTVYPLLRSNACQKRKILVRIHRSERCYFWDLFKIRHWGVKKLAFLIESVLFKKIESGIISHFPVSVSSEVLYRYYKGLFPKAEIHTIPGFTGIPGSFYQEGKGGFCLYHGELSNRENEYAAQWLLEHVFNTLEIPFVIAGYGPSKNLEQAAHIRMHTCLVADPGEKEMLDLVKKAQINILPSFISNGNRTPLLRSLSIGKHVVTNVKGITDKEMMNVCEVARTPQEFSKAIKTLFEKEFEKAVFEQRESYLNRIYRDTEAMHQLLRLLY